MGSARRLGRTGDHAANCLAEDLRQVSACAGTRSADLVVDLRLGYKRRHVYQKAWACPNAWVYQKTWGGP